MPGNLSARKFAEALGATRGNVSAWIAKGMPTISVEAAKQWMSANVRTRKDKGGEDELAENVKVAKASLEGSIAALKLCDQRVAEAAGEDAGAFARLISAQSMARRSLESARESHANALKDARILIASAEARAMIEPALARAKARLEVMPDAIGHTLENRSKAFIIAELRRACDDVWAEFSEAQVE